MFVPKVDLSKGGTPFGNSYVTLFESCKRKWFNEYYRPIIIDGKLYRGITGKYKKRPLLTGDIFHVGLAAWYESGVVDGEDTGARKLDAAIAAVEAQSRANYKLYQAEDEADADLEIVKTLVIGYHDFKGPGGEVSEWPEIRVQCDQEGKPLIEKMWTFPLNETYVYTCRTDLIIENCGYLQTMEHKTCSVYGVRYVIRGAPTNPQFSGENWTVSKNFPDSPVNGTLVNMVVKDRGLKSKYLPVERRETTRSEPELERWRLRCIDILQDIDDRTSAFEDYMAAGSDIEVAADRFFPPTGMGHEFCYAYNSDCEYLGLCQLAGLEQRQIGNFRGKTLYDE